MIAAVPVMKYLLSITLYLSDGTAMTKFDNSKLYPTIETCTVAGNIWKSEYKKTTTFKCQLVNEENWK